MILKILTRLVRRLSAPAHPRKLRQGAPMAAEDIDRARRDLITAHGPWTAHNIHLGEGIYTIGPSIQGDEIKLARVVQIVADCVERPLDRLRVLDLACLEGMYALEFARHGSAVVAIEGRETNLAKARFAADLLGLGNAAFFHDDVRNLSRSRHGSFDAVLCLGILYHLDAPDVFLFLERIAEACTRVAVIDTHVSELAEESRTYRGRTYWGRCFVEHPSGAAQQDKERALWASLDNERSFWPTRNSLLAALSDAGFSSAYECHVPFEPDKPAGRITLLAIKGGRVPLHCAPLMAVHPNRRPEDGPAP